MKSIAYEITDTLGVMDCGMEVARELEREEVISVLRLCQNLALRWRVSFRGPVAMIAIDTQAETAVVIWALGDPVAGNPHTLNILHAEEWQFPARTKQ